ncbi:small integral membrane protein 42 [Manis pentadactyla]|uniref:small integral membrane protein 42 n=1 Tax=Manis pentadactyla TaxID=143292 RepID=UPI00255CC857|nr:small integral membrane protein 42 [Manis pentadactyla]
MPASPLLLCLLRWVGSLLTPHTPALSEKPVSSSQLAAFSRDTNTLTAAISDPAYLVKVLFLALLMTLLSLLLVWEATRTESRQHYCWLESSWQRLRWGGDLEAHEAGPSGAVVEPGAWGGRAAIAPSCPVAGALPQALLPLLP